MKKLLLIFLALWICAMPLVSCQGDQQAPAEESAESDAVEDIGVLEPFEERTVTKEALGYSAAVVSNASEPLVADASVDGEGSVVVASYNPGTSVITVKNSYAEKLELRVTVGEDRSIEKIEFDAFQMPEKYVYADDYGLKSSNAGNANSAALQAAIDALDGGGTVYVPRGFYEIKKTVEVKSNVTIRLEGVLEEYNTEYSADVSSRVNSGKFAVIRASGNDMFINHKYNDWGRTGSDNIAFIGGVLDMGGRNRCFIWSCADGVLLENVVMKDCPNNHAIQITGSDNVTIRDCMFAGYNVSASGGNVTSAETIQIESTDPVAIGGDAATAPSRFEENEYYHCENVVIENVYFGPSDKYGSHTFPIGHHNHTDRSAVTGLKILGCTFHNPRVVAIRCFAYSDVEIASNKFLSNEGNALGGVGRYMIELNFKDTDVQTNGAYLALSHTRQACLNYNIHDNVFEIGEKSKMGGAVHTLKSRNFEFDAKAYDGIKLTDFYTSPVYSFTGYQFVQNRVENMSVCNNRITMKNNAVNSAIFLSGVRGLTVENNEIESTRSLLAGKLGGESIYGGIFSDCISMDQYERTFVVSAFAKNRTKPVVMTGGGTNIEAFCTAENASEYYKLSFSATEGGRLERHASADGSLILSPTPKVGYAFDGYYLNGVKLETARFEFSTSTEIEVRFVAK